MVCDARKVAGRLRTELEHIYGSRFRGAFLFGSYARGEADAESDLDLLIVLDKVTDYRGEIDRTGHVVARLSLDSGVSISRIFVSELDWRTGSSVFLRNVRAEAVPA